MNTIRETGGGDASLTVSGGAGNTDRPEIHLIARAEDEQGKPRAIGAWFDRDALLDAITEADPVGKCCRTRLSEPAAAE